MTSASDFVSVQQCSSLTVPNYSKKIVTCKTCYDFFLFFLKKFQNTKLSFFEHTFSPAGTTGTAAQTISE
jgi:hypothetical protein